MKSTFLPKITTEMVIKQNGSFGMIIVDKQIRKNIN